MELPLFHFGVFGSFCSGPMNFFTTCIKLSCMSIFLSSGTFLTNGNKLLRKISSESDLSSVFFLSVLMTLSNCFSHSFSFAGFFLFFFGVERGEARTKVRVGGRRSGSGRGRGGSSVGLIAT